MPLFNDEEQKIIAAILKGDSAFIRYSSYADGSNFTTTRQAGQNYVGLATGQAAPEDKSGYQWLPIGEGANGDFVPKGTPHNTYDRMYILKPNGTIEMAYVSEDKLFKAIVRRDSEQNIVLPSTQKKGYYCVHQKYVEDEVLRLETVIAGGKDIQPTITQPSVSISVPKYEVGATVNPKIVFTFDPGRYSYEPKETGVTILNWECNYKGEIGHLSIEANTITKTCDEITISDNTSIPISVTGNHSASSHNANTFLGKDSGKGISAGTKTATATLKGYRKMAIGMLDEVPENITSDLIRSLMTETSFSSKGTYYLSVPKGTKYLIVAYPESLEASVKFESEFAGIWEDFTANVDTNQQIAVDGASEGYKTNYVLCTHKPSTASGVFEADITNIKITLS